MRLFFLVIALLSMMAGCAKNTAGISIDSSSQNVVLSDAKLAEKLDLGNAKTKKVNDRLLAEVKLTNKTTDTQNLQYRFYWYDDLGLELNVDESPWQLLVLYGGESKSVQGVAVSPSAENFRVSIRNMK